MITLGNLRSETAQQMHRRMSGVYDQFKAGFETFSSQTCFNLQPDEDSQDQDLHEDNLCVRSLAENPEDLACELQPIRISSIYSYKWFIYNRECVRKAQEHMLVVDDVMTKQ